MHALVITLNIKQAYRMFYILQGGRKKEATEELSVNRRTSY